MPLVSEAAAAAARETLKRKLAQPLCFWGGPKTVFTEEQFKARVGWKEPKS
jgi:hypothetical protein